MDMKNLGAITINFYGEKETLSVIESEYQQGGLAICLIDNDGCPFSTLSVWVPETPTLPKGVFYLKEWSENEPITQELKQLGVLQHAEENIPCVNCGHVIAVQPYRLNLNNLKPIKQ